MVARSPRPSIPSRMTTSSTRPAAQTGDVANASTPEPGRFEILSAEFDELAAELERLGLVSEVEPAPTELASPAVAASPVGSPGRQPASASEPGGDVDPMLLPVCGTVVDVTLIDAGAVLQFRSETDGRPILLPLAPGGLEALAHAVADAIRSAVGDEAA